jgi:transcriptional regulator GlxA family with amidase domain
MDRDVNFNLSRRSIIAGGALAGIGLLAGVVKARQAAAPAPPTAVEPLAADAAPMPVAFLMDDGITMIDFAGPWEVFQDAGNGSTPGFSLFTVASTSDQLQTTGNMTGGFGPDMKMSGLKFHADYRFDTAPQPKVIVIGAQGHGANPAKLDWIRNAASNADVVMSVCTGAFVLASTGLLDGLSATTHHNSYDRFAESFPKVKLVRGTRFIDNGKFITAGGLTSGIDTALHVVNRYFGSSNTQQVAEYMEYRGDSWRSA